MYNNIYDYFYMINTSGSTTVKIKFVDEPPKEEKQIDSRILPTKQFYNLEKRTYTVLWSDGTETTSHAGRYTDFDHETGFMACVTKKFIGDRSEYMKYVDSGKETFSKKVKYSKDVDNLTTYELAKLLLRFID